MRTHDILIVIDMQKDFIDGVLGSKEAVAIIPAVNEKIKQYEAEGKCVIYTQDTHSLEYYPDSIEGKHLPVPHCIAGTEGWEIHPDIYIPKNYYKVTKLDFAFSDWIHEIDWFLYNPEEKTYRDFEICGVCTDICVVSNALELKREMECEVYVDANCCAGTSPEAHEAAIKVMKSCQINVENESDNENPDKCGNHCERCTNRTSTDSCICAWRKLTNRHKE